MIASPMGVGWAEYARLRLKKRFVYDARVRNRHIKVKVESLLELWRCKTYETKEPETLDWIDSFSPGAVMFDVGANIGLYSLYAAASGATVCSFEPEAQNFASLTFNLLHNRFANASCYCIALADKEQIGNLFITGLSPGDSQHNLNAENPFYRRSYVGKQGSFSTSLDRLCFDLGLSVPNHVKIDVDGIEPEILLGARKVLRHPSFRSLLVEVNAVDGKPARTLEIAQEIGLRVASTAKREHRDGRMWGRNFVMVPARNAA
jgi:FkbM family methyltransferase